MKAIYEVTDHNNYKNTHREILAKMLEKQGKIKGPFKNKIDKCKCICIALIDGEPVAIGAIKEKTKSVFTENKANVLELCEKFDWELGYLFTDPEFQGNNIASEITQALLQHFGDGNLMASTEIKANPNMVKILESNNFRLVGQSWKSMLHEDHLGLFLKFK